jgi:hypothetical protein
MQRHTLPFRASPPPPAGSSGASMAPPSGSGSSSRGSQFGSVLAVASTVLLTLLLVSRMYNDRADTEDSSANYAAIVAAAAAAAGAPARVAVDPALSAEVASLAARLDGVVKAVEALGGAHASGVERVADLLDKHGAALTAVTRAVEDAKTAAAAAAAAAAARAPASAAAPAAAAAGPAVVHTAYDAVRGVSTAESVLTPAGAAVGGGRGCVVGPYDGDFDTVTALLKAADGPGFAFVRYADGELGVAQGRDIGNEEWHFSPGQASRMQADLLESLKGHFGQRYWYAFASPLDDTDGLQWYLQRTEQSCGYVSYANMWVNSHYPRTQALLQELTQTTYRGRTVLVVNEESVRKVTEAGGLPAGGAPAGAGHWAVDALPLADNLVTQWENTEVRGRVKAAAEALASRHSGALFMVSGGPVGKVIIAWMWASNPSNKYVDFGSTLDPFLRGKVTRAYHNPGHQHASQVDPRWYVAADGRPTILH